MLARGIPDYYRPFVKQRRRLTLVLPFLHARRVFLFITTITLFSIFQSGMEVNTARFNENADESQAAVEKSEDHKKLLEYGINENVADRLDEIYASGEISLRII